MCILYYVFYLKMHQNALGDRAPPGPTGEITALLRPPSWIKGRTCRGATENGTGKFETFKNGGAEMQDWKMRERNIGVEKCGTGKFRSIMHNWKMRDQTFTSKFTENSDARKAEISSKTALRTQKYIC